MANREKGEVAVSVDGVDYTLVLDFNAICEIENLYDMAITQFVELIDTGMKSGHVSLKDLRAILWAAMKKADPGATLVSAGQLAGGLGEDLGNVVRSIMDGSGMFDVAGDEAPEVGNASPKARKAKPAKKVKK